MRSSQRVGGRVVGPEQSSAEAGESFAGLAGQAEDVVLTGPGHLRMRFAPLPSFPHFARNPRSNGDDILFDLALPVAEHEPTLTLKLVAHFIVTLNSSAELLKPIVLVRRTKCFAHSA